MDRGFWCAALSFSDNRRPATNRCLSERGRLRLMRSKREDRYLLFQRAELLIVVLLVVIADIAVAAPVQAYITGHSAWQ